MASSAVEKLSRTGEVLNDFTCDNKIELGAEAEVSRVRTHHVKSLSPQSFDLVLFIVQSHQRGRPFTKNAVKPVLSLPC